MYNVARNTQNIVANLQFYCIACFLKSILPKACGMLLCSELLKNYYQIHVLIQMDTTIQLFSVCQCIKLNYIFNNEIC